MILIVAGGRRYDFTQHDIQKLDAIRDVTEVVSGGAPGADACAEDWAAMRGLPCTVFQADWSQHGKVAGPIRNRQMAQYANAVVLFPGGPGTDSMFDIATKAGLKIFDWRKNLKVTTIAVSYERKINLGDYNSLKLEATMWAEVEPGDDADQCILALQGQTREAVKREYRRLKGTVGPGEQVTTKAQIGEPVPAAS